jgi:hypothetical protein
MIVMTAGRRGCISFALDFFVSFFIKKKRKEKKIKYWLMKHTKPEIEKVKIGIIGSWSV